MRKVKWGVMGTAGIAKGCTIPGMQQAENCEMAAVAGRSLAKAEQHRDEFGFRKAYGSYEELLADSEIEAVYIPLPNDLHCEWAIKALNAKKHVLCEKPLAPSAALAEKMIQAANDNGVYLMEAFAYLHSPLIRAFKEEYEAGTIGEMRYIEAAFATSDYDKSNIRMQKDRFGGSVYDLGCYCTSLILWVMGEEPTKVQAIADYNSCGVDDAAAGLLTFANGARAAFSCGMVLATEQGRRMDRMAFYGTKGSMVSPAEFNQSGELRYTINVDGVETVKTVQAAHNYRLEVEQLGECILGNATPHVSNAFTMMNARVIDKILEAIQY